MRVIRPLYALALAATLFLFVGVPAAEAGPRNHPSSNTPWVIGLAVVVVLVGGFLLLRLRRGVTRDEENSNFRE